MRRANFVVKKKSTLPAKILASVLVMSSAYGVYSTHLVPKTMAKLGKTEARVIASIKNTMATPVSSTAVSVTASSAVAAPVTLQPKYDEFNELEKRFHAQPIAGIESLEREKSSKAIRITLNSDAFFQLGTAKIENGSKESIQKIISILKPLSSQSFIEIEGHTDDSPVIHQKPNYPSNWELSAARAASFIPLFSNNGFFKDQLKVIGYGDSRPVVSNHMDSKVSAKNRRIVLRIFPQEDERRI